MIEKKIVTPSKAEWNRLVERLEIFKTKEQYHLLLESIIFCIKMIKEGQIDINVADFSQQIVLLLEMCKLLDENVQEFLYRKNVGEFLLGPLCKALHHQNAFQALKIAKDYIAQNLPFESSVSITLGRLCNHAAIYHDDFINYNENNPHQKLLEIHVDCLHYAQSDLDKFSEVAIIMRILDFWRTLSYNEYRSRDIRPLIGLGNDLLAQIKESASPLRKKALWRVALLLQMLLRDHPSIKDLKSASRELCEFELGLIPFDYSLGAHSISPVIRDKFEGALFKDYKSELRESRELFEQVKQNNVDVFKAQCDHSQHVITMLKEMVKEARDFLGPPLCEIQVCILGSTSRHDRRPYSDLEYMILHGEVSAEKKKELDVYICHLISIFELMIVRLGETAPKSCNDPRGLSIDTSVLESKNWGTPEAVAKRYVTELILPQSSSPTHPWLNRGLFEFLHPIALECPELGSEELFKKYKQELGLYLRQTICDEDVPHMITRQFEIKREDWWKRLRRRQGIALASLCEVVHTNEKVYLDLNVGNKINLKALYYKPLIYCALSLALYEGWQELVPLKIIQLYCKSMPWGGEALLLWWQAALGYVLKEQVKQHLESHCQDDSMIVSEDECWAGFDLIVEGFILPLQRSVWECLSGSLSISMLGYVILKSYFNVRRVWLEKWQAKGLKRSELLNHPLMQVLSSYPDQSGWSPQMELLLKRHHEALLKLSSEKITACELSGLPGEEKQPPRYLNEKIIQECFKEGKFVGDPKLSSERSQVKEVMVGDKSWYIKVKEGNLEGLMAREYLAMMAHLLLGGKPQVALGWPIQLCSEYEGKTKFHYAWISEGIGGDSLGKVMLVAPETLEAKNIDPESFTQLFLLSYLICPEDGQPENFKVVNCDGRIQLVAIDYGQCFVQLKRVAGFFKNREALVLKTMIYLLESMDEALSNDLITRIRLLDINQWFDMWVEAAIGINAIFRPLLKEDPALLSRSQQDANPPGLIDVEDGLMLCVKKRLELLQYWLRTTDERITARNLLRSCDRLVYLYYESLRGMINTPKDFYKKLDKEAYEENAQGKVISSLSMMKIKEGTMTASSLAQSCDLEPSYFRRIHFGKLNKDDQKFTWELLEAVASRKGDQFFQLDLSGGEIEEGRLIRLLEKMTSLQVLNLTDCQGISVLTVSRLLAHRPGATLLTYDYNVLCPKLQMIKLTVEAEQCELILNISSEQRQLLTRKLKNFIEQGDRVSRILLSTLKDPDPKVCVSAAEALVCLGKADDRVIEVLVKTLSNSVGWDVIKSAAKAMVRIGKADDRVSKVLLEMLSDSDAWVRVLAAKAMVGIGKADDRVIEVLVKALVKASRDPGADPAQAFAAKALVCLGKADDRVIEALMRALSDSSESVRNSAEIAFIALGRIGKENDWVIEALLTQLNGSGGGLSGVLTLLAAIALVRKGKGDDRVIEALVRVLSGSFEWICGLAAEVLVLIGKEDDTVIEALLKTLRDSNVDVRSSLVKALGRIGKADDRVIEALLRALSDSGWLRRGLVAKALGRIGKADDRVIEALLRALSDSDWLLRTSAAKALARIGKANDQVIKAMSNELRNSDSRDPKPAPIDALGKIFQPKICWKRIRNEVQRLPTEAPVLLAELKEEQSFQAVPELRLSSVVSPPQNFFNLSFFGKPSLGQIARSDVDLLDSHVLDKVALASQRAIVLCESEGVKARCRVIPAEPDGDCGFTGTSGVLDLLGRVDIASQISRIHLITLVRREFEKDSLSKPVILQIFKIDGVVNDDENEALERWGEVFVQKSYWMQEAHFRFISMIFNLEFCFYCVDSDKNILLPELGSESIYEGRDSEAKIVVNLLHMTVCLRDENTQLNHFDGLIINPTLEQEQKIDLLLAVEVSDKALARESDLRQNYSQVEKSPPRW